MYELGVGGDTNIQSIIYDSRTKGEKGQSKVAYPVVNLFYVRWYDVTSS